MGYRLRNDVAQDEVALAVVVQQMVPSEASGVLFTANPLTGQRIRVDGSTGHIVILEPGREAATG
jgi:pyruvate,water dikinase